MEPLWINNTGNGLARAIIPFGSVEAVVEVALTPNTGI